MAILAGLAPLFRPTAIVYGMTALGLALWLGRKLPRRTLALAVVLFTLGLSTLLATNQARYGSPFEFGHRLNLSYNPVDQYGKDFGDAYRDAPLGAASAELLSALFLSRTANGYDFLRPDVLPFQSPLPRFREFYFATFSPWMRAAHLWASSIITRSQGICSRLWTTLSCLAKSSEVIHWR